jgi:uncharacterized protein
VESFRLNIWIDADACPSVIKDILFRAAERAQIQLTLVANQAMRLPPSRFIRFVQVAAGLDVADQYIADSMQAHDLVITADIPLAAKVIERNGVALNPRGELYTPENIRERLSMRNFMDELRSGGVQTGGPAPLSNKDKQAFANKLDAWIAKRAAKREWIS